MHGYRQNRTRVNNGVTDWKLTEEASLSSHGRRVAFDFVGQRYRSLKKFPSICLTVLAFAMTPAVGTAQGPTELHLKNMRETQEWESKIRTLMKAGQPSAALVELENYAKAWPEDPIHNVYAEAYLMVGNEEKAIEHFRKSITIQGREFPQQEASPNYFGPQFIIGRDSMPRYYLKFAMILFRRGEREAAMTIYYEQIRRANAKGNTFRELVPFQYHFEAGQPGRYLKPTIENFNAACHLWLSIFDSKELGENGHLNKALSFHPNMSLAKIYLAVKRTAGMVPKDEIRSLLSTAETTDEKMFLEWLLAADYDSFEWNLLHWDHTIGYKRRSENPAFLSGIKRMRSVWQKIAIRWKD